jgi:hypothetical protein
MIAIDDKLISDELVEKDFVCNLTACKGHCCVEGEAGAPLEKKELKILDAILEKISPFLSEEGLREIRRLGTHVFNRESGFVTPTIGQGICAYGVVERGIVTCGIEKAYRAGKTGFIKPISCHLYPVRIERKEGYESVNYVPRDKLCSPACVMGRQLEVPVFRFLKEALIRNYGEPFYEALEAEAREKFGV